jgi:hypothetical protein
VPAVHDAQSSKRDGRPPWLEPYGGSRAHHLLSGRRPPRVARTAQTEPHWNLEALSDAQRPHEMGLSTSGRYWARTRLWGSGRARLPDFTGLRFPEISSGSVKLLPKLLPRLGEACQRPPRGYAVVNDIAPASQQLEFGLDSGRPTASTAPIRFHIAVSDLVRGFRRVASAW